MIASGVLLGIFTAVDQHRQPTTICNNYLVGRLSDMGRAASKWSGGTHIKHEVHLHALVKSDAQSDNKFDVRSSPSPCAADSTSGYNVGD